MDIRYVERIASTHQWLVEAVKTQEVTPPFAIYAGEQHNGVGSRGNEWKGCVGNLYFSFCVNEKQLPDDLPPASISIYFAWLMREVLVGFGSNLWLKWPNDFYLENKKIGGVITAKTGSVLVGSMGVNLVQAPEEFGVLDIKISSKEIIEAFVFLLEKKPTWKNIFSKYRLEFQLSQQFSFHMNGKKVSLSEAFLCDDGSIEIENKKVYSLR